MEKALEERARAIRRGILEVSYRAGKGHVGAAFSVAEIMAVLYFDVMRIKPEEPDWPGRDRFILSKGHACTALYSALFQRGFFEEGIFLSYCRDGGRLWGHPKADVSLGIEFSTGSLGHGLPVANGMALAGKFDGSSYRVFVVMSDGECQEGSVWEAALFAGHHKLDNLTAIIDYNGIQATGRIAEIADLEPFADKWRSFGWRALEVDGHDVGELRRALRTPVGDAPTVVIARTVKGKGVSFMENEVVWHYISPDEEVYRKAMAELGRGGEP